MFTPGALTRDQANELNRLDQLVKALHRMSAASPLSVRRFVGQQPMITLDLAALASQLDLDTGSGSGSGSEDLTTLQVLTNICLNPFTIPDMVGATSGTDGAAGLVPKPLAGDDDRFLRGDGTYATPAGGTGTVTSITVTTGDGLSVSGGTTQTIVGSGTFALEIDPATFSIDSLGDYPALTVIGNANSAPDHLGTITSLGARHFVASDATNNALAFRAIELADLPSNYNRVPPGVLCPWPATSSVPSGWVEVGIGGTASRTGAAGLYAAWGTDHGIGDGLTTFGLPDFRGRALICAGTGTGLTARANLSIGGFEAHILSTAEMPAHTHSKTLVFFNKSPSGTFNLSSVAGTNDTVETMTTSSAGGGSAHNNMQPWYATRFITPMN